MAGRLTGEPCPECGTRGVCPRCRAERTVGAAWSLEEVRAAEAAREPASPVQAATVSSTPPATPPEADGSSSLAALERAVELTTRLATVDAEAARLRLERRDVLRQATAGLPVTHVAARLGVTRQWVHKLLR